MSQSNDEVVVTQSPQSTAVTSVNEPQLGKESPNSTKAIPTPLSTLTEQIFKTVLSQTNVVAVTGPRKGNFEQDTSCGLTMPQPIRPVFPGLMKTPSQNPFNKADIQSTLSASLAPKSGFLPSQREQNLGRFSQTSESTSRLSTDGQHTISPASTLPVTIITTSSLEARPTAEIRSTPTTSGGEFHTFSSISPTSTRKQLTYVLPDGSVTTSGKGLGRGRPGIKRGPRKSKLATELKMDSPAAEMIIVETPNQMKRSRVESPDTSLMNDLGTPSEHSSSQASSEEYHPQNSQTRSGRQTQKPISFVPSVDPVLKKPRMSDPVVNVNKSVIFAKIKRKVYRGKEYSALCEHCLRGNGPPGNVIVFCDACNKCWHQRCHDPVISQAVIKDTKAEWYCSDCEKIINGPKKGGKKAAAKVKPTMTLPNVPRTPLPMVGGSSLTREQREAQLAMLSREKLIELVMRASDLAPLLPLFDDPNPPKTPVDSSPTKPGSTLLDSYPTPTQDDEYEYYFDEHAALYPKPGSGVKLPPEREDLGMLLEGPECKTFSHTLSTPAQRGIA